MRVESGSGAIAPLAGKVESRASYQGKNVKELKKEDQKILATIQFLEDNALTAQTKEEAEAAHAQISAMREEHKEVQAAMVRKVRFINPEKSPHLYKLSQSVTSGVKKAGSFVKLAAAGAATIALLGTPLLFYKDCHSFSFKGDWNQIQSKMENVLSGFKVEQKEGKVTLEKGGKKVNYEGLVTNAKAQISRFQRLESEVGDKIKENKAKIDQNKKEIETLRQAPGNKAKIRALQEENLQLRLNNKTLLTRVPEIRTKLAAAQDLVKTLENNRPNVTDNKSLATRGIENITWAMTSDVKFNLSVKDLVDEQGNAIDAGSYYTTFRDVAEKAFPGRITVAKEPGANPHEVIVTVQFDGKNISLAQMQRLVAAELKNPKAEENKALLALGDMVNQKTNTEYRSLKQQALSGDNRNIQEGRYAAAAKIGAMRLMLLAAAIPVGLGSGVHQAGKWALKNDTAISVSGSVYNDNSKQRKIINLTQEVHTDLQNTDISTSLLSDIGYVTKIDKLWSGFAGKTRIDIRSKVTGEAISKEQLVDRTSQKVAALQGELGKIDRMLAAAGPEGKQELEAKKRTIEAKLMNAQDLLAQFHDKKGAGVTEYFSVKKEALNVVTFLLNIPILAVKTSLYTAPKALYTAGKRVSIIKGAAGMSVLDLAKYYAGKVIGDSGKFTDPQKAKIAELAERSIKLEKAFGKEINFNQECQKILDEAKAIGAEEGIKKVMGRENVLLKLALAHGNADAANLIMESGLMPDVSKDDFQDLLKTLSLATALTPADRRSVAETMFRMCTKATEQEEIINYLLETNQRDAAESIISYTLKQAGWNPVSGGMTVDQYLNEHYPNNKTLISTCLLQAARLGSAELIVQAFGVNPELEYGEIQAKMKPYIGISSPSGTPLAHYAGEGVFGNFAFAVGQASEEYFSANHMELRNKGLQELKQLLEFPLPYKINAKIAELTESCPELGYLKEIELTPDGIKLLGKNIDREVENASAPTIWHMKDNQKGFWHGGVNGLRKMNPGTAEVMDQIMKKEMNSQNPGNGKVYNENVFCFASAVAEYQIMGADRYGYVTELTLVGKFAGCVGAIEGLKALHPAANAMLSFLEKQTIFQGNIIGGITGGFFGGMETRRALGRIIARRQGLNNEIAQYREFYGRDANGVRKGKVTDVNGKSAKPVTKEEAAKGMPVKELEVKSLVAKAVNMVAAGANGLGWIVENSVLLLPRMTFAALAFLETKIEKDPGFQGTKATSQAEFETSKNFLLRKIRERKIEMKQEGEAKKIAKLMKFQNTDQAIAALTALNRNKEQPKPLSADARETLLDGLSKLKSYTNYEQRIQVLDLVFDLLDPSEEGLQDFINDQLQSGSFMAEKAMRDFALQKIKQWQDNPKVMPSPAQYKAVIYMATTARDFDVYRAALQVKGGQAALTASEGWIIAEGTGQPLLHAAALTGIGKSNSSSAAFAKEIASQIVRTSRLALEADPLKELAGPDNFFDMQHLGKKIQDHMTPELASALDEAFMLDPKAAGSFSYMCKMKHHKEMAELLKECILVLPAKLAINLEAGNIADTLATYAGHAAFVASHGNPVASVVAEASTIFVLECCVLISGFAFAFVAGKGLNEVCEAVNDMRRGYSDKITQIGTDRITIQQRHEALEAAKAESLSTRRELADTAKAAISQFKEGDIAQYNDATADGLRNALTEGIAKARAIAAEGNNKAVLQELKAMEQSLGKLFASRAAGEPLDMKQLSDIFSDARNNMPAVIIGTLQDSILQLAKSPNFAKSAAGLPPSLPRPA